jgi:hypothetical protein
MNSARDTPKSCPLRVGCPIRRSRDQRSLASPPGFSQRAASFIASQCQGIHQMPFFRARSQGTPAPRDDPQDHPKISRTASRPPENRRAQGQAPPSRERGAIPPAAARMKTLLRTAPGTGSCPAGQQPHRTKTRARGPSASVTFTNPLHPSINASPGTPAAGAGHARPAAPEPEPNLVFSERRRTDQELRSHRAEPGLRFSGC